MLNSRVKVGKELCSEAVLQYNSEDVQHRKYSENILVYY